MGEELLPIPHVPPGLREAALRGILIPFIGAGVSRIAGCPSWPDLADGALRFLVGQGKFSHSQLDQIKNLNPRVKLSIALGLSEEYAIPMDFRSLLHPSGRMDDAKGRQLYGSLSKFGKTFITTNYDEWLDKELAFPALSVEPNPDPPAPAAFKPRRVVHRVQDLTAANLNQPNTVIHLHGSLLDPDNMILTTQDYVRHYANDRLLGDPAKENRVLTFLEYLFNHKTMLFLGYGLEELEILEYVIIKARRIRGDKHCEAKHYLLQGFFSHENELMRSLKRYYLNECGIQLIPYLRDQKDWDQLLDVLGEFARIAPAAEPMQLQEFKEMEDLLDG